MVPAPPDTIVRGTHPSKTAKGGAASVVVVQRWASPRVAQPFEFAGTTKQRMPLPSRSLQRACPERSRRGGSHERICNGVCAKGQESYRGLVHLRQNYSCDRMVQRCSYVPNDPGGS